MDRKFRRACQQVELLNCQLIDLKQRYDRAAKDSRKSFRCSTRLRLASMEGVRNMMYKYAEVKCVEIQKLQDQLMAHLESEDEMDSDDQCWTPQQTSPLLQNQVLVRTY